MKIQITRKDLNEMVYKTVKRILKEGAINGEGETSGYRGVRQIILNNIMAKHPEFMNNNDLAFAYYVCEYMAKREKTPSTVNLPSELIDRMEKALRRGQEERARINRELINKEKATDEAFRRWLSNPDNKKLLEMEFSLDGKNMETEEECYAVLKEALEYKDEYKNRTFSDNYEYDDGNGEMKTGTYKIGTSNDNNKKLDMLISIIKSKLLGIQKEIGDQNFKTSVFWCQNDEGGAPAEFDKRMQMANDDEMAQWYSTDNGWRCYIEKYCPKYKVGWSVDSSD